MEKFFIKIYVGQIKDQISEAEKAYTLILLNFTNHDELFSAIHHFIVHVSNVVKILQPSVKDGDDFRRQRALAILEAYAGIPKIETQYIGIRNDFEHFDERIDFWINNSLSHNYVDKGIGDVGPMQAMLGIDPRDCFRWFDYSAMTLYFCGKSYNLKNLNDYIGRVKNALCG